MLRQLKVFETDKSGELLLDRNGETIALENPQPKSDAEKSEGELAADASAIEKEADWKISRYRQIVERNAVLAAAEKVIADGGAAAK